MKKIIITAAFILIAGTVFSQTLQKGGILGVRTVKITLNPDVTMNQFLDFVINTYLPESEKVIPGMKGFIMRSIPQVPSNYEFKEEYTFIYYIESEEVYRKYFDTEGTPTDKGMAAIEKFGPLTEKLNEFATESGETLTSVIL